MKKFSREHLLKCSRPEKCVCFVRAKQSIWLVQTVLLPLFWFDWLTGRFIPNLTTVWGFVAEIPKVLLKKQKPSERLPYINSKTHNICRIFLRNSQSLWFICICTVQFLLLKGILHTTFLHLNSAVKLIQCDWNKSFPVNFSCKLIERRVHRIPNRWTETSSCQVGTVLVSSWLFQISLWRLAEFRFLHSPWVWWLVLRFSRWIRCQRFCFTSSKVGLSRSPGSCRERRTLRWRESSKQ